MWKARGSFYGQEVIILQILLKALDLFPLYYLIRGTFPDHCSLLVTKILFLSVAIFKTEAIKECTYNLLSKETA